MSRFKVDAAIFKQDDFRFDAEAIARIDANEFYLNSVLRWDAAESAFFARQLEFLMAKTYDVVFANLKAQKHIPIGGEAGPGAESITYQQYTASGFMKLVASYANDLPRAEVWAAEFTIKVKSFANAYGYNIDEVRNAMFAGVPLTQRKANAARQAYEQMINHYAWFADGSANYGGLYGMFYNANITKIAAPTGSWCNALGVSLGATPLQILADMSACVNASYILTKGVEKANTLLMPLPSLTYIKNTYVSELNTTTIFKQFTDNNPGVEVDDLNEAWGVSPSPATPNDAGSSTNIMLAYEKNPDKVVMQITQPFEQLPVQEKGLEYEVPCHARHAGVMTPYPLSITLMYGI